MSALGRMLPTAKGVRAQGLRAPLVVISRLYEYGSRRFLQPAHFEFDGGRYRYFCHFHNATFQNERIVEIPLIRAYLEPQLTTLEVGNVLAHYMSCDHDVVDKYEVAPGVINEDIVEFQPSKQYDLIVSISTIEHVGWDEEPQDGEKIPVAVKRMKTFLKPGGRIVLTLPFGYNPHLDRLLSGNELGFDTVRYLRRVSKDNRWEQVRYQDAQNAGYGKPFLCANALAIATYERKAD